MIINKEFKAKCRGCGQTITLYEYKGLEGSLYGSHHCQQMSDLFIKHPRLRKTFTDLKEVK